MGVAMFSKIFLIPVEDLPRTKCYTAYKILFTLALTFGQIIRVYDRFTSSYQTAKIATILLDILGVILSTLIIIIGVISENFVNCKHIRSLFKNMKKVDLFLNIHDCSNHSCVETLLMKHKWMLISANFAFFATVSYDMYGNYAVYNWKDYLANAPSRLVNYKLLIFVLQIYVIAGVISERFVKLNAKIEAVIGDLIEQKNDFRLKNLAIDCMKCHDTLSEFMRKISKIHGWQLLLIDKLMALHTVEATHMGWIYFTGKMSVNDGLHGAIVNIFWSLDFLICGALISFSCGSANRQANSAITVCQKLIGKIDNYSDYGDNKSFAREILTQFSRQVDEVSPHFQTAGYFAVDYGFFFTILGSIINYMVIILQFEQ